MGVINFFPREKLIIGVLTTISGRKQEIEHELVNAFGNFDYCSGELDFISTDYYTKEMGPGIKRLFYSFADCVDPGRLAAIKIQTNDMEKAFTVHGKRKVNLDPGILNLSRLILASTKDNMHRIPLTQGIYAEVTLVYMHKQFHSLLWTYPDYDSKEYKAIFSEIREKYRLQLKQQPKNAR